MLDVPENERAHYSGGTFDSVVYVLGGSCDGGAGYGGEGVHCLVTDIRIRIL